MKLLLEKWREYVKQEVESFLPHGTVRDINMIGSSTLSPEEQDRQDMEKHGHVQAERDIDIEVQIADITREEAEEWAFSNEAERLEIENNYDVQLTIVENWRQYQHKLLVEKIDLKTIEKGLMAASEKIDQIGKANEDKILQLLTKNLSEAEETEESSLAAKLARRATGAAISKAPVVPGDKIAALYFATQDENPETKMPPVLKAATTAALVYAVSPVDLSILTDLIAPWITMVDDVGVMAALMMIADRFGFPKPEHLEDWENWKQSKLGQIGQRTPAAEEIPDETPT